MGQREDRTVEGANTGCALNRIGAEPVTEVHNIQAAGGDLRVRSWCSGEDEADGSKVPLIRETIRGQSRMWGPCVHVQGDDRTVRAAKGVDAKDGPNPELIAIRVYGC